jgi:uncharacterized protein YgiM (DUF1202 family)
MKTNHWLVLGTLLATSAVAQVNTNNLWAVPPPLPPMTNAPVVAEKPAALPVKKTVHHKKRTPAESGAAAAKMNFSEPMITLVPGPAEIIVSNVNVRGQAGLKGEVVAHVKVGDTVTVLSQINLDKHKADEPAQWAKILLPASTKIWVNAEFIEPTSKTVRPKKLNLRAGPSEDYSVLGVIERGTPVSEIITRNGWMQIETPTNAYGFLAATFLKQEAPVTPPPPTIAAAPEVVPVPTPVPEAQPIVTEPTNLPAPAADTNSPVPTDTNSIAAAQVDTNLPPPPPRVVTHEGVVRHVTSIIEPTPYELSDPKTGADIDYLFTTSTNLDLSRYNGLHIIVTGEEGIVERWKDTPVLTIQRILVVPDATPADDIKTVASPRASHSH